MDSENSNTLYNYVKSRFDHERNKQILREKYHAKMIFAHDGGMWEARPSLITLLINYNDHESIVIEDLYHNPIKVNPKKLLEIAQQHWQEQMNAWLVEYEINSRKR